MISRTFHVRLPTVRQTRSLTMAAAAATTKKEGDISSAFVSLSGGTTASLPSRYRDLKLSLARGREHDIVASWQRLLAHLRTENAGIAARGASSIPTVDFDKDDGRFRANLAAAAPEIRTRGAAVIRGVMPRAEARGYKDEIEAYLARNAGRTRAFPQHDPQVWELYWSGPQVRARAHHNMLAAQRALLQELWHVGAAAPDALSSEAKADATVSLAQPMVYADRLRIRQPGDASFALGPHIDGGSVERWEREGYGVGNVYDNVFKGRWDVPPQRGGYNAHEASGRAVARMDRYDGLGSCSMFRSFQGWLSLSRTAPGEGTLRVYPNLRAATAYVLLRPFFRPVRPRGAGGEDEFLAERNWVFTAGDEMTSDLQGATPGHGQEVSDEWHPHLELDKTMISVPAIEPGDYVVWHCDTIHAVDPVHTGTSDSSVLYIPVCPTTESNAAYLARQRDAFLAGTPGPDFPGGKGEAEHEGRPDEAYVREHSDLDGLRSVGFERLDEGLLKNGDEGSPGEARLSARVNRILGFS